MKKLLALSLLAIFMMIGFSSCKKYEDGPMISFRSKKARLINDWKLSKATSQGTPVNVNSFIITISIKDDDSYSKVNTAGTETGTWKFDGSKENVIFTATANPESETLRIIKLKNKELTLERTDGNQVTLYELVSD